MVRSLYFILLVLIFSFGCSKKWTQAIRKGSIQQKDFKEEVSLEIKKGLYFVPIQIKGKTYKFLFDTGAPFSISQELQQTFNFPIISKGNIVDSDHNRKKVNWVSLEALKIGGITFENQTAFVADLKANPILECLDFDGIIGSNFQRHCNWEVDATAETITLSDKRLQTVSDNVTSIAFKTDNQYDIFIDLVVGEAQVNNVLVDFGSNSSFSMTESVYAILEHRGIIITESKEKGLQQSGLVGKAIELNQKRSSEPIVGIKDIKLIDVEIKTGKTTSIGTGLLSRCRTVIDWENQMLHFENCQRESKRNKSLGIKLGKDTEGVYIQSVLEPSPASQAGLQPGMRVFKFGDLDFEQGNTFCDYVFFEKMEDTTEVVVLEKGKKKAFQLEN